MTIEELIAALKNIVDSGEFDTEEGHDEADGLLVKYINDPLVTEAYDDIPKWYA